MNKRVVSIQDISCVGQCSLTAALPVLAACGVECAVLPTALLSTHTGPEFTVPTKLDLTEALPRIHQHWKENRIPFDAIEIGYLGSERQIGFVSDFLSDFHGPDTIVFLDPVMGDHGRFYSGFDREYARSMAALCGKADIILPNLTEACFLLDREPVVGCYDVTSCLDLARRLTGLGAPAVILTGLELADGQISNLIYRRETDALTLISTPKLPGQHHGTGDLFASACLGRLMCGDALPAAAERASAFVSAAIANTEPEHKYGVRYEACLRLLMN